MLEKFKKIFMPKRHKGYQCFNCLEYTVCWDNDFDFEDYGLEGEGIVHSCHCMNCGAEIEYFVRNGDEE